ncbi:non-heme iron oxygenase ferredoxin subunit [Sphingomonas sp. SUN039]|uniref:Rieske (2Fe-2S) protein n=1 Tax=Sphingomonas sp. SUN039 TaxID=2937787 RepID=UPI002164DDF6|nr:non-heme iron oxygenase ferredoxin subunit [Sphingomonas sp. SUN039]UVO55885.1 non-heme iron oxygenase ferredoxin subunit [Sphingomonas sp. SUN039]
MVEPKFHPAADVASVPRDSVKAVTVDTLSVLLVHTEGGIFAVENRCSHAEEPLACGRVKYGWIACPAHGARFDLETGEPLTPPATAPIRTFPVRIDGDTISVLLS